MKNKIRQLFLSAIFVALFSGVGLAQQTADEYLRLGNQQLQQKNYEDAARNYGECIRLAPKSTGCYFNRGIARFIGIGYGLALEDFNAVIGLDPNDAKAFRMRGQVYEGLKNAEAALADYNQAIRLKPDFAQAFYNRAYLYSQKGDDDRAIADYTQAVKFNPNYDIAFAFRGSLYQKKGKLDEAIADFTRAIQIKPDYARAFYSRGKVYREQGKIDLSDADFARAVALDPQYKVQVDAVKTIEKSKKTREALDKMLANMKSPAGKSPARTPAEEEAYKLYQSGTSKLFGKRYDEAIADLTRSIGLNPKSSDVFLARGESYFKKANYDKALADFNEAVGLLETNRELFIALNWRAETFMKKGDYNSALTDLNRALQSDKSNSYGYYLRGKAHLSTGKTEQAKADFKKALEIRPDYKEAGAELGKLGAKP